MSTLETYRQAITTEVEVLKTSFSDTYTLLLEYENRQSIDTARQADPYLSVEIVFTDGWQGDLNPKPFHRIIGAVILTAKVKKGSGKAQANTLLEHFYTGLQQRRIGEVKLETARPVGSKERGDWIGYTWMVPFWLSKLPA